MMFLNHYECPRCNCKWSDEWDATCDDDCPKCGNRHISPTHSEDIPTDCETDLIAALRECVTEPEALAILRPDEFAVRRLNAINEIVRLAIANSGFGQAAEV